MKKIFGKFLAHFYGRNNHATFLMGHKTVAESINLDTDKYTNITHLFLYTINARTHVEYDDYKINIHNYTSTYPFIPANHTHICRATYAHWLNSLSKRGIIICQQGNPAVVIYFCFCLLTVFPFDHVRDLENNFISFLLQLL